jgi:hypothetical protein
VYIEVYRVVKDPTGKVEAMFLGGGKVARGSVDEDSS